MRSVWLWAIAVVVALTGVGLFIGFASQPPAKLWTFQYLVVGTQEWRDWRLYGSHAECEQARRFMLNLEDGLKRRLVETRQCFERENPARAPSAARPR